MKPKRPSFQFYPDSWLSSLDITLMTISEEGAYHRLLCHEWEQEDCGLPDDDGQLAVLSKMGRRAWDKSRVIIRNKFVSRDGRLYNERLLVERDKQAEWARKSSNGGKHSAAKRKPPFNHPSTTLQPPLENGTNQRSTLQSSSSSSINTPPTPNGELSEFESEVLRVAESIHGRHPEFRRDIGVKVIAAKLRTICKGAAGKLGLLSEIDESHESHCESEQWTRDGGQYAKGLENWLAPTKRRWESSAGPKANGLELFDRQPPESMVLR